MVPRSRRPEGLRELSSSACPLCPGGRGPNRLTTWKVTVADEGLAVPWPYRPLLPGLASLAIVTLMSFDLVGDWRSGSSLVHIGMEGVVMALAIGGVLTSAVAVIRDARLTRISLAEAEGLLRGLGEAIDRQFATWSLTPAEREVSPLLLKGLSTKEIATARRTSDQTVRQQARAIYPKAGLGGRAELAAFFLEDLLLPLPRPADGEGVVEGPG